MIGGRERKEGTVRKKKKKYEILPLRGGK